MIGVRTGLYSDTKKQDKVKETFKVSTKSEYLANKAVTEAMEAVFDNRELRNDGAGEFFFSDSGKVPDGDYEAAKDLRIAS